MIRIGNLSLPPDGDFDLLRRRAARALGVRPGALEELEIVRESIDARDKGSVRYIYTVETTLPNEASVVRSAPGRNIALAERERYCFPEVRRRSPLPPVVVGMGPAGLFAALFLARNGLPCVVLGRGPAYAGCGAVLGRRCAGRGLQRPVRRGGRGRLLRW